MLDFVRTAVSIGDALLIASESGVVLFHDRATKDHVARIYG